MNTSNKSHFLSLSHPIIKTNGLEQLVSMWSVISKCKDHLEEGNRLENMSWRLWHQKHGQHFVKPNLSLSAGMAIHEVSQAKQTQNNHVPDKDGWSFTFNTVQQQQEQKPLTTKAETAGSTHAFIPSTTTTTSTTTNNSRTTTPSLSNSYQYEIDNDDGDDDDFFDEEYDDDFYDNDDLYDENDNYIYDEEEAFMHQRTEKLRPYHQQQAPYFKKTLPRPLRQQPSLLSALFKTSSQTTSFHPTSRIPPPPDHFLKKEWTESLRDNVLWEHVQQQKPLYIHIRSHPSYYHNPPPSSTYQSPYHRHNNNNSNRPPFKKTMIPSDQGCLESFHGW